MKEKNIDDMTDEDVENMIDVVSQRIFNETKIIFMKELGKFMSMDSEKTVNSNIYNKFHIECVQKVSFNLMDILFRIAMASGVNKFDMLLLADHVCDGTIHSILAYKQFLIENFIENTTEYKTNEVH